ALPEALRKIDPGRDPRIEQGLPLPSPIRRQRETRILRPERDRRERRRYRSPAHGGPCLDDTREPATRPDRPVVPSVGEGGVEDDAGRRADPGEPLTLARKVVTSRPGVLQRRR